MRGSIDRCLPLLLLLLAPQCARAAAPTAADAQCAWDDLDGAVERFAASIRFATVSNGSAPAHVDDAAPFHALDAFLRASYPLVWERLEVEKVRVCVCVCVCTRARARFCARFDEPARCFAYARTRRRFSHAR